MTNEERDRRDRRRAVLQPIIGSLAVALLFALVLMMWQVTHDRQAAENETASLADRVTTACDHGGEAAEQLRKVGACQQAATVPAASPGPEGPSGAQGSQGDAGPPGPRGETGAKGEKGDTGATGPQGPAGEAGSVGAAGPVGTPGATGEAGAQGPAGETGPAGPAGPQGPQGPPGPQGPAGPSCPDGYSLREREQPLLNETWLVCVKN